MTTFGGENAESYYDEGLTASMKGDLTLAIAHFEKTIHLDRSFLAAYHQLGKCYLRTGQTQRAIDILQKVLQEKPANTAARLDLGNALLNDDQVKKARDQFALILRDEPHNPRAYLGLAKVSFEAGDWPAAVNSAQQALTGSGQNFSILFVLGRAAKLTGDSELAEQSLKEAEGLVKKSIELNDERPEGYYLYGEVSLAQDNVTAALDNFQAAESRGKKDTAYSAFNESFSYVDIFAKLGLCYQRLGQIDRAKELGAKVIELEPEHRMGKALTEL